MNSEEFKKIISQGETSKVQFKLRLDNKDSIADEMIAMANSEGGIILFGIEDKSGNVIGLSYQEMQQIGNTIATLANDYVKPQIFVRTEAISIDEKNVFIVNIDEGIAKPYKDKNGTIWVKQGSDKRKLTDNNEQIRLFQQNGLLYADEMIVPNTSIDDISDKVISEYLTKIGDEETTADKETIYKNINILNNNRLTLGGLLFFGKNPQKYRPALCIKAVSFFGNDATGTEYRDSEDIVGTIPYMFERGMSFFTRTLHHIQKGQNFNSVGILEISRIALEELLQNALTHRDYSINAPINLFVFDNRIEIISPGKLPNSLTIENIKMGNAVVRNNLIVTFSSRMMKYRGIGTGVRRALKEEPLTELINDTECERFIVRIPRPTENW
ncbi:MAG: putative DNA binding domain-containing protein [Spirochaetales bacterium]|nr:putative DNA binding domain-containing protein [Spirochaetales bacterium]